MPPRPIHLLFLYRYDIASLQKFLLVEHIFHDHLTHTKHFLDQKQFAMKKNITPATATTRGGLKPKGQTETFRVVFPTGISISYKP